MIKAKTKNICSICQNKIPRQDKLYITCPICGNQTWQTEIIEEFEELSWWKKFKRRIKNV
jgi:predicted amidophosphoribosyltransferase